MPIPEKFHYVLSNPPYQEAVKTETSARTLYTTFMLFGSNVADMSMMLHPLRAFRGTGRVKQEELLKIVENPHFGTVYTEPNSRHVFPDAEIKGGVVITSYHSETPHEKPLQNAMDDVLLSIRDKVVLYYEQNDANTVANDSNTVNNDKNSIQNTFPSIQQNIYTYKEHTILETAHAAAPEYFANTESPKWLVTSVFNKVPEVFVTEKSLQEDFIPVFGRGVQREVRWIHTSHIDVNTAWMGKWKVFVPHSSGTRGAKIGKPAIGDPDMLCTQTFLAFGMFDEKSIAENCLKYLTTRFARALLSILKVTQHNAAKSWRYVPVQDFTQHADIDWSQTVENIDAQLYAKYGLSDIEQQWIEEHIAAM